MNWLQLGVIYLVFCFFLSPSQAVSLTEFVQFKNDASTLSRKKLTPQEQESLRFHLENLYNELDLLFRNEKVDQLDLVRQERELALLKVFERIPFQVDKKGFEKSLKKSVQSPFIKIHYIRWDKLSAQQMKVEDKVPKKIYSDQTSLAIRDAQIVEEIPFECIVTGPRGDLVSWIKSWSNIIIRIIEFESIKLKPLPTFIADSKSTDHITGVKKWTIRAKIFRFKEIDYPRIVPRNPRKFLPSWANSDFDSFSKSYSKLAEFVTEIEELTPKAKTQYIRRERFFLNQLRYSLFNKLSAPIKIDI